MNLPHLRAWVAEHADPYIDGFDGTLLLELCDELETARTELDAFRSRGDALLARLDAVRSLCAVRGIDHARAILILMDNR